MADTPADLLAKTRQAVIGREDAAPIDALDKPTAVRVGNDPPD